MVAVSVRMTRIDQAPETHRSQREEHVHRKIQGDQEVKTLLITVMERQDRGRAITIFSDSKSKKGGLHWDQLITIPLPTSFDQKIISY